MKSKLKHEELLNELSDLDYNQYHELLLFIVEKMKQKSGDLTNRRSIIELEGLGAELWSSVDIADYINTERKSW